MDLVLLVSPGAVFDYNTSLTVQWFSPLRQQECSSAEGERGEEGEEGRGVTWWGGGRWSRQHVNKDLQPSRNAACSTHLTHPEDESVKQVCEAVNHCHNNSTFPQMQSNNQGA